MIDVMFLDEKTARETAEIVIEALGEDDAFARRWISGMRHRFGLLYRTKEYREIHKSTGLWVRPC